MEFAILINFILPGKLVTTNTTHSPVHFSVIKSGQLQQF